jgi:hypothetical protein
MRNWIGAIAALVFVVGGQTSADPLSSTDIVSRVAKDFRQALPAGYDVAILDPLTITFGLHGKPPFKVNLDNIKRVCLSEPDRCDAVLADFTAKTVQFVKIPAALPSKSQLRAVVRAADYVDDMRRAMKGEELISAPLFGDLVELCYFDMPTAMSVATTSTVKSLGLTPDEALALCKRNVESTFPKLRSLIKIPAGHPLGMLTGDDYQSSRILFHDDWSPVAAQFGGHLIVAVPASDVVVFGRETDPIAVKAVVNLAQKIFHEAQRPISTEVFRWTATGWDIAAP